MEAAIKLNIGNKMEWQVGMDKAVDKKKKESAKNAFSEAMIAFIAESSGKAKTKSFSKENADEELEGEEANNFVGIAKVPDQLRETGEDLIISLQGEIPAIKAEAILLKPEFASADTLQGESELVQAVEKKLQMQTGPVKEACIDREDGLISTIRLKEDLQTDYGKLGKGAAENGGPEKEMENEMLKSIRVLEAKAVDTEEKGKTRTSTGLELKQFESRGIEALEKGPRGFDHAEALKEGSELLNSAKEQSLLGRLAEIEKIGHNAKSAGQEKLGQVSDEATEKKSQPKHFAESSQSFEKAFGQALGIDGRMPGMENARVKLEPNARPIENLDEIGAKIELAMDRIQANGKSSLSVKLKPEELGSIEIKLVQENGIVKARILVESEAVKEQLKNLIMEDKNSIVQDITRSKEIEVALFNQTGGGAFKDFEQGAFAFQKESGNGGFLDPAGEKIDSPKQPIDEIKAVSGSLDMFA